MPISACAEAVVLKNLKSGLKTTVAAGLLAGALPAAGINNNVETTRPESAPTTGSQVIPYAFFNADTGVAAAAVWLGKGYIQPQVLTVANVWYGASGSYQLFWANTDVLLPFSDSSTATRISPRWIAVRSTRTKPRA